MYKLGFKIGLSLFLLFMMCGVGCRAVLAAPHLTLSPTTGSFTNGSNFTVAIGVDSGTEKSSAVDVWGTFDNTRLEIVSIVKASTPAFAFDMTPHIFNDTGKFDFSCASSEVSGLEDKVITGDLAVVTFKTKAVGVASMGFSCTSGSSIDSNIFKSSGVDVIDCATNQSGSYTITASTGESTATATPTTSATTTATPTTKVTTELPKTGGIASTLGLVIFGGISVLGALFLRIL